MELRRKRKRIKMGVCSIRKNINYCLEVTYFVGKHGEKMRQGFGRQKRKS